MLEKDAPPAMLPPPGMVSNYDNPHTLLKGHIALHTVFLTMDTLCLAMRLYTRKFIHRKLALEDYVIVFSYIATIAYSVLNLQADAHGLGRHMWDFPFTRHNWVGAMKPFLVGVYPYIVVAACVKLSCLLFYRHIFSASHRTMWSINTGIGFLLISYTAMFFSISFECIPIQRLWDPFISSGHCFDPRIQTYSNAALNTFTDVFVLVVPIPALWVLPVDLGRKIRVIAVFGLGAGACVTSIVRLVMMAHMYSDLDVTWNMSAMNIWSVIELNTGFCCSCLLVLPAFLKRHLPPGFSSTVTRVFPCLGRRAETSTKTYLSGSGFSQHNRSDESSVYSPTFTLPDYAVPDSAQISSPTVLINNDNVSNFYGLPRKGPHSG